jgi:hypothetical protein
VLACLLVNCVEYIKMIFYYRHNYGCTGTCVWLFIYDNFIGFWPVPFDVLPFFYWLCGRFLESFVILLVISFRYWDWGTKKNFWRDGAVENFFLHTTQLFFHHQKINNIFHIHGDLLKQIKKLWEKSIHFLTWFECQFRWNWFFIIEKQNLNKYYVLPT